VAILTGGLEGGVELSVVMQLIQLRPRIVFRLSTKHVHNILHLKFIQYYYYYYYLFASDHVDP